MGKNSRLFNKIIQMINTPQLPTQHQDLIDKLMDIEPQHWDIAQIPRQTPFCPVYTTTLKTPQEIKICTLKSGDALNPQINSLNILSQKNKQYEEATIKNHPQLNLLYNTTHQKYLSYHNIENVPTHKIIQYLPL